MPQFGRGGQSVKGQMRLSAVWFDGGGRFFKPCRLHGYRGGERMVGVLEQVGRGWGRGRGWWGRGGWGRMLVHGRLVLHSASPEWISPARFPWV